MTLRLKHIAEAAGVSEATVSRVLNGKTNVSRESQAAVHQALEHLGYRAPEKLRPFDRKLVGLIVPELTNPIFPLYAQTIANLLHKRGCTTILCTVSGAGDSENEYLEMLLDRGVSGIVFISGRHANIRNNIESYRELNERNIPLVMINGFHPEIRGAFVSDDAAASIKLSLQHLFDLGHQNIGFAAGRNSYTPARRKIDAFTETMARYRPRGLALVCDTEYTFEGGETAGLELIQAGCTAVLCANDMMALGVARTAANLGLQLPRDLSIIGYDDSVLLSFTQPPLTTVRQNVEAIAIRAVDDLLEQVHQPITQAFETLVAPNLVVRGSTATAPTQP